MKNERPMPIAKKNKGKPPNHRPPDPPTNNPREPFPTQIPSIASVAPPRYPLLPTQSPDPPPTLNAIRSIASVILGDASAQTPGVPETSVTAGSEMPAARKHPRVSRYESMLVNLSPARSFVDGVQCRLSLGPVTWPLAPRTSQPKLLHPRWTQGLHRIEPWPRGIGNTPPATPEGETDDYYQKEWTWSEEPQEKEWTWSEDPRGNEGRGEGEDVALGATEGEDVVRGATEEREEGVGIDERVDVALGATEGADVVRGATGEGMDEEGEDVALGATGEREDVVRGATEGEERGEVALWPLALVFWGAEGEDVVRGATGERATGTGIERVEVGCFSSNLFRNDAPAERGRGEGTDVALATGERGAGDVVRGATGEGVDKCLLVRKYLGAVGAGTPEREDVLTMVGTDGAERTEGRAGSF
ncbi:hypothetical protein BO79DRAFT_226252 [Aspergillus costaricaensis CBS 115574]|uniref:Uncharacterized protein n=1 Tax=Aspergillus costaricaensis CBS 115574 TaxID=1448317 RepID=A0ACD1ILH5_9EURO|nr:hypothetical protein BO79DRAFT_226252 [Aspergillus costaricaensis CBS 115574]RAK91099.1 hypothetical protein BO79DRAFT_226252 [Aspergillus costaricaensis CBS 115574]